LLVTVVERRRRLELLFPGRRPGVLPLN